MSSLTAIRGVRGLTSVHWFGHGAPSGELQFGGGNNFGSVQLGALKNADVSKHFEAGGLITFFGCNAGQKPEFLQGIANVLCVSVAGFDKGVRWDVTPKGESPRRTIVYRGVRGGELPIPGKSFAPK